MNQEISVEVMETGSPLVVFVWLLIVLLMIVGLWKAFSKAGQSGWACLIPIYNTYVFLIVAGKPGWWLILFFIPFVNIIIHIVATLGFAEKFGKGAGFAIGLLLLPFIFYPVLGLGQSRYQEPATVE